MLTRPLLTSEILARRYSLVPTTEPASAPLQRFESTGVSGLVTYATNQSPTDIAFRERRDYADFVFPDTLVRNSMDMWQSLARYIGRIDTHGNAIIARGSNLKQLRYTADETTMFALDFVADAWRDFSERLRSLAEDNIMIKDSIWAAPLVYKGWNSITNEYHQYLTVDMFQAFSNIFLENDKSLNSRIVDMKSFLQVFGEYYERAISKVGPLTLSGFVEGPFASPLVSGLVIEIGSGEYDEDAPKAETYINDPAFMFVTQVASEYGFAIDQNIPWRLVADVTNPAMREYMYGVPLMTADVDNKNALDNCNNPVITGLADLPGVYGYSQLPGLQTVIRHATGYDKYQGMRDQSSEIGFYSELYKNAFDQIYMDDIDVLKVYLLDYHNRYVTENPHTAIYDSRPAICRDDRHASIDRSYVSEGEFFAANGQFGDRWALNLFYLLRSTERSIKKNILLQRKDMQKIMNIYSHTEGNGDWKYLRSLHYMQENMIGPVNPARLTTLFIDDIVETPETQPQRASLRAIPVQGQPPGFERD